MHGLKRCFFHEQFQIEINFLKEFLEWHDAYKYENVKLDANEEHSPLD
jgi:hypothetical protein